MIQYWQKFLRLNDWLILSKKISRKQVTFPDDIKECDRYYIGVFTRPEIKLAIIYNDRELTDADVLHELLHVKWPNDSEDQINFIMRYFLKITGK